MRLLFYLLVAAAAILIGIGQLIALGWQAHKRRKAAKELRTRKPPEPTLSDLTSGTVYAYVRSAPGRTGAVVVDVERERDSD